MHYLICLLMVKIGFKDAIEGAIRMNLDRVIHCLEIAQSDGDRTGVYRESTASQ